MKQNSEYRQQARLALNGNWLVSAATSLIIVVLSGLTAIVSIFVANPLDLGFDNTLKKNLSNRADIFSDSFKLAFSENYLHKMCGMLLMSIFVLLWSLLLIVPGIIMSFAYALTPYILAEEPELPVSDAISKSRAMMQGHKAQLFTLYLSFIGWFLLCILTCGIGCLWLIPYIKTSVAAFYEDIKAAQPQAVMA